MLETGQKAPNFTRPTNKRDAVSLSDFLGKQVILYFYPKDNTPGCTTEACDFRDSFSRIDPKKAVVFGVSKDSLKSHTKFVEKYSLPFELISDEDGSLCEAYGVWTEKSLFGVKYMGLERATFLIDAEGKIKKIWRKVKVSGHVDEVLAVLEEK